VKKIDTLDTLQKRPVFTALQGIRGIAVLLVILSHSKFAFSNNGFVGVDIFFVVSGFLITRRMIEEYISNRKASGRQGWISFVGFYIRRARKVIPAAFFVIVVTLLASIFLTPLDSSFVNVVSDATWALFFLANLN
jgi:peptidoglycan/LPS O-acetylase OafA/YrhL